MLANFLLRGDAAKAEHAAGAHPRRVSEDDAGIFNGDQKGLPGKQHRLRPPDHGNALRPGAGAVLAEEEASVGSLAKACVPSQGSSSHYR